MNNERTVQELNGNNYNNRRVRKTSVKTMTNFAKCVSVHIYYLHYDQYEQLLNYSIGELMDTPTT